METNTDTQQPQREALAPATGSRFVTVVYCVTDEAEWKKTNPLTYEHNGLTAMTIGVGDAYTTLDEAESLFLRLDSEPTVLPTQLRRDIRRYLGAEEADDRAPIRIGGSYECSENAPAQQPAE
jgi:hypothetical protein